MATVRGIWIFNDTLTQTGWASGDTSRQVDVNFTFKSFSEEERTGIGYVAYSSPYISYCEEGVGWVGCYHFKEYEYGAAGWHGDKYKTIDFGETEQEVPDDFYNWLLENTINKKVIRGKWIFNDVLTDANFHEYVNFTCGNSSYHRIMAGYYAGDPAKALFYAHDDEVNPNDAYEQDVYFFEEWVGYYEVGWSSDYKTIDFGETKQAVSIEFYDWFIKNATRLGSIKFDFIENGTTTLDTAGKICRNNIEINVNIPKYTGSVNFNIAKNGTTTLTTAGKYCDKNIGIDVNIPTYDDELVDVTITEFINTTVEKIGIYGLGYKGALKKIDVSRVTSIADKAFYNNRVMDTLIIRTPEVCSLATATDTFKNTKIAGGTGYIYVPDNLVDAYKVATNWSTFANQIKSIEKDLEE